MTREEEEELIPSQSQMTVAIVVVRDQGRLRCFLVWSRSDLYAIEADYEWVAEIGWCVVMPDEHERQPLELGGDYPQAFWKLANFLKTRAQMFHWSAPMMFIMLWTTEPDEPCGMIGGLLASGQYRLCLYFDKQTGRELTASFAADNLQAAEDLKEHSARIDECLLPETGGAPVIELDPPTSRFLCWLWQMHLHQANRLP